MEKLITKRQGKQAELHNRLFAFPMGVAHCSFFCRDIRKTGPLSYHERMHFLKVVPLSQQPQTLRKLRKTSSVSFGGAGCCEAAPLQMHSIALIAVSR